MKKSIQSSLSIFLALFALATVAVVAEQPASQTRVPPSPSPPEQLGISQTAATIDPSVVPAVEPAHPKLIDGRLSDPQKVFRLTQGVSPLPAAPQTFDTQSTTPAAAQQTAANLFGGSDVARSTLSANRRALTHQPGTNVVLGSESKLRVTTDAGSLLGKSPSALNVQVEKRNPIITDVRVRGAQAGSMLASGSYWFPVRQDLDTMMSKIDSRIVEDMIVIKGPYAARYGPGESFVDFQLLRAPRYENGYETHGNSSVDYKTNGEQWYGRQSVWGGNADYGFRVGYGHRTGVDYETGDGQKIPSSYNSRDVDVALGFDLTPDSDLEISYLRLDQTDVELPNQVNDISYLGTDAFEATYTRVDDDLYDEMVFESWWNQSRMQGNAQGSGKRRQIPVLNAIDYIGFVEGWNMSTGFTLMFTWEGENGKELTAGADMRYLRQELNDFASGVGVVPPGNYALPSAYSANPGVFFEATVPQNDRLQVHVGGRFDWVNMNASTDPNGNVPPIPLDIQVGELAGSFDQSFDLGMLYATADYKINEETTATGGLGFGMRAPTMMEMYSNEPWVAIQPQFPIGALTGNPFLRPERRWQIDVGLQRDTGSFRAGANGFFAWVQDYITLDTVGGIIGPGGEFVGLVYQTTNTELATLAGFEAFMEYDLNDWVTVFANTSFTEGRDHTRRDSNANDSAITFIPPGSPAFGRSFNTKAEEPLYGVYPMDTRAGIRIHEPSEGRWGVEFMSRIVRKQDRVAATLFETATPGFTIYNIRTFAKASENVTMVAGVENLTDKQYREHFDSRINSQVFRPGINYYFGTEVTY